MVDLDIRWFPKISPDPVQIQSAVGSITWRHCAGRGWTKTIVVSSLLFVVLTLGWGRNPASTPLSVSTHASLRNRNHTKNRASIYIYISLSSEVPTSQRLSLTSERLRLAHAVQLRTRSVRGWEWPPDNSLLTTRSRTDESSSQSTPESRA